MYGGRRMPSVTASSFEYPAADISPDMSFLEMLDVVNEGLIRQGRGHHHL